MCGKQRKNILIFQFGKYVKDTALCCRENLHYRPKRNENETFLAVRTIEVPLPRLQQTPPGLDPTNTYRAFSHKRLGTGISRPLGGRSRQPTVPSNSSCEFYFSR